MKKYKSTLLEEALSELNLLEKLLNERIVENNLAAERQSGLLVKQFVHSFMLYREKVETAQKIIKEMLDTTGKDKE